LKRVFIFLEDGEWSSANEYCEKILDKNPECSKAYIGKLMAKARIKTTQNLYKADYASPEISRLYEKACRYADTDDLDLYKSQRSIYEEMKRAQKIPQQQEKPDLLTQILNKINPQLKNTPSSSYSSGTGLSVDAEIARLEEKHRKQIIWACIGLIYWPVAVVLFICASSTKKKIEELKRGRS
jgi:tetratricopeptide (TPR) repeat protein